VSIPDEQLKRLILQLAELSGKNVQLIQVLNEHLNGQAWVLRTFAEVVMSSAPEVRERAQAALGELLATPERIPGDFARELIEQLHQSALALKEPGAAP